MKHKNSNYNEAQEHKVEQCFVGLNISESTITLSFCLRSCCSNLKWPWSGINTRVEVCASPVGDGDAGVAGGACGTDGDGRAGGVYKRDI